jgi:hypothetical protein
MEVQMRWVAFVFVAGLIVAAAGTGIRVASAPTHTVIPVGRGHFDLPPVY